MPLGIDYRDADALIKFTRELRLYAELHSEFIDVVIKGDEQEIYDYDQFDLIHAPRIDRLENRMFGKELGFDEIDELEGSKDAGGIQEVDKQQLERIRDFWDEYYSWTEKEEYAFDDYKDFEYVLNAGKKAGLNISMRDLEKAYDGLIEIFADAYAEYETD